MQLCCWAEVAVGSMTGNEYVCFVLACMRSSDGNMRSCRRAAAGQHRRGARWACARNRAPGALPPAASIPPAHLGNSASCGLVVCELVGAIVGLAGELLPDSHVEGVRLAGPVCGLNGHDVVGARNHLRLI